MRWPQLFAATWDAVLSSLMQTLMQMLMLTSNKNCCTSNQYNLDLHLSPAERERARTHVRLDLWFSLNESIRSATLAPGTCMPGIAYRTNKLQLLAR